MSQGWHWTVAVSLCVQLAAVRPVVAQVEAADTAAVVYQVAQRAEGEGDRRLAEALLRWIVRQYPGTPAARDAERWLKQLTGAADAQSGRVELMVWGTTYGAWLGVAIPLALSADDPQAYGAGLLLGAPTGLLAAEAFARSGPMSLGQARTIRLASMWGTWQGIGWREVLDLGTRRVCDQFGCYEEEPDEAPVTAAILGGLTGIGVGAALARTGNISAPTATMVELASYWGTWYGLASGVIFDAEEDALLTVTLLSGNAALLVAALVAPKLDVSVGRARLISIVGLAGALVGFGIDLLLEVDDEQAAFAIPMVTSALGLAAGVSLTREYGSRRSLLDERSGSALVNIRDGRVAMGAPAPVPVMLPRDFDGVRRRHEPGVKVTLLEANF